MVKSINEIVEETKRRRQADQMAELAIQAIILFCTVGIVWYFVTGVVALMYLKGH